MAAIQCVAGHAWQQGGDAGRQAGNRSPGRGVRALAAAHPPLGGHCLGERCRMAEATRIARWILRRAAIGAPGIVLS